MTPAQKRAKTIRQKYGKDFFKVAGSKGGAAQTDKPKGFAARPELASESGRKGGLMRGKK